MGARRVVALINRRSYVTCCRSGRSTCACRPRRRHRRHCWRTCAAATWRPSTSLRRGAAEALEAVVHGDASPPAWWEARIDGGSCRPGPTIAALVRPPGGRGEVIMAHHDTWSRPAITSSFSSPTRNGARSGEAVPGRRGVPVLSPGQHTARCSGAAILTCLRVTWSCHWRLCVSLLVALRQPGDCRASTKWSARWVLGAIVWLTRPRREDFRPRPTAFLLVTLVSSGLPAFTGPAPLPFPADLSVHRRLFQDVIVASPRAAPPCSGLDELPTSIKVWAQPLVSSEAWALSGWRWRSCRCSASAAANLQGPTAGPMKDSRAHAARIVEIRARPMGRCTSVLSSCCASWSFGLARA